MRAVPGLLARDLHAVVEPARGHRLAERLRPVGVRPLADGQERRVLPERHVLVERGDAGLRPGPAPDRRPAADPFDHGRQVLGSGPAAPADQGQPELGGEAVMGVGQLPWGQRVTGAVGGELGQPGVGHAGQRDLGVPGQVTQVLAHLARPGGAVQPDGVHAERLEGGERGPDLAAEQHGAGGLDRHLHDQRHAAAGSGDGAPGPHDGRLGLQQVLAGLHDQGVGAAAEQARGVVLVAVAQLGEGDVPQRGQLGARAERAESPARTAGGRPGVGRLPGDPGRRLRQFADPAGEPVLTEVAEIGAERVGGDAVHAHGEIPVMDRPDDVRPGLVQYLVAALVTEEIVARCPARLQHGAHGPVGHHHPFRHGLQQPGHCSAHRPPSLLASRRPLE